MPDDYWKYLTSPISLTNDISNAARGFEYIIKPAGLFKDGDLESIEKWLNVYHGKASEAIKNDLKDIKEKKQSVFAWIKLIGNPNLIPLGKSNRLDRFIWDFSLRTQLIKFQVLTLFTSYIQANYILIWNKKNELAQFYCTFFELNKSGIPPKPCIDPRDEHFIDSLMTISEPFYSFHDVILWNQYIAIGNPNDPTEYRFKRRCQIFRHSCRSKFNNVPLVTKAILPSHLKKMSLSLSKTATPLKCKESALLFYDALAKQNSWVVGVGTPMRFNLDQLGSAMSNQDSNITLVSGLPGTGKENYMKALHFAGTSCSSEIEKKLVTTTALELEKYKKGVAAKFKDIFKGYNNCGSVTCIIDELNKAKKDTRSAMLRVLENPSEVVPSVKVRFIMGASDHLDRLARDPPQDFWTRITNQMHVVHPLGRVAEEDAEIFLEAFFWFSWWSIAKDWLNYAPDEQPFSFVRQVLGKELQSELASPGTDDFEKCPELELANIVCEEFVQTVTPIAIRDEVSIRGLRSMMKQIFSNVMWSTRYGLVPGNHQKDSFSRLARRGVNHAIQDVMAILNAARATPRTTEENGDGHSTEKV